MRLEPTTMRAARRSSARGFRTSQPHIGEGNYITYGDAEVAEEVRAVQDAGYEEWMLWSAANKYHLEELSGDGSSAAAAEVLGEGEASSDGGETSAETEPETAQQ